MSKLEDKLIASIKPSPRKAPAEKSVATAVPQRTRAPAPMSAVEAPDLDNGGRHLHPDRIWPD